MTHKSAPRGRGNQNRGQGRPKGKGGKSKRPIPARLDPEAKAEMKRLMETECLRKPMARRIASGELTLQEFKLRHPQEYARSYRAKNLLEQNPGMTRARAFWLAEDPQRIQAMREKQIRTFATHTGLSLELSQAIATGAQSLPGLAKEDQRWAFIWDRARARMKVLKQKGLTVSPMEAIRWARGDFGLPFDEGESEEDIEAKGQELHDLYPFMKKRHTRRMARFDLDLDGLAKVAPANCGWGPRANELHLKFPGHHRKFIRLMAMMELDDPAAERFIEQTAPAREKYAELAASGRRYFFQLYDGEFTAALIRDDNPFSWRLTDSTPERTKQSKLQVLYLCPSDARHAIVQLAERDETLISQRLGPAFEAEDRLDQDFVVEHLDRAKSGDKEILLTLRSGIGFRGHVEWYSPFETMIRLKNNAWVMVLFHAIHRIQM